MIIASLKLMIISSIIFGHDNRCSILLTHQFFLINGRYTPKVWSVFAKPILADTNL